MAGTIDIGAPKRVILTDLEGDDTALVAATVTYHLTLKDGAKRADCTELDSDSMPYDAGDSRYAGVIPPAVTADLDPGTSYYVWVVATEGGYTRTWQLTAFARYPTA